MRCLSRYQGEWVVDPLTRVFCARGPGIPLQVLLLDMLHFAHRTRGNKDESEKKNKTWAEKVPVLESYFYRLLWYLLEIRFGVNLRFLVWQQLNSCIARNLKRDICIRFVIKRMLLLTRKRNRKKEKWNLEDWIHNITKPATKSSTQFQHRQNGVSIADPIRLYSYHDSLDICPSLQFIYMY